MAENSRPAKICSEDLPTENIQIPLTPIAHIDRYLRGIKALVILWTLALISVFIPLAHFVLVPGFFFGGIFFALNGYTDAFRVDAANLKCLKCKAPMKFRDQLDQFPKWVKCSLCQAEHRIELIG